MHRRLHRAVANLEQHHHGGHGRAIAPREPRVLGSLDRLRDLAGQMVTALEGADLDALGRLVGEHWVHQRALHPAIPTPLIDTVLADATAAGALGGKALGASGGGLRARHRRRGAGGRRPARLSAPRAAAARPRRRDRDSTSSGATSRRARAVTASGA